MSSSGDSTPGGITVLSLERIDGGLRLTPTSHTSEPAEAGYLAYGTDRGTLYAVDERKTDGRGPAGAPAAVHAFAVDPSDGHLTALNSLVTPGPFPTYLALDETRGLLISANHGGFDHVEKVSRTADESWAAGYDYDDSTVVVYRLDPDGALGGISDVQVMDGHGLDPNSSLQAGGHAQSAPHAHSAVIDPSGTFVLVGDKGTDRIRVYRLGSTLQLVHELHTGDETAPRHLAFDPVSALLYATCELSSELAVLEFDQGTGRLRELARTSTVAAPVGRTNEPADVRVHPAGGLVYVNNRGEDSLAWFRYDAGVLRRVGAVELAASIHPGLAARSFAFDPTGSALLLADRPAGLVRAYDVDPDTGALKRAGQAQVPQPAFVSIVELPGCVSG